MVNGKKLLASILVGAMVITGSPVVPAWSVATVEAAAYTVKYADDYYDTIQSALDHIEATATGTTKTVDIKLIADSNLGEAGLDLTKYTKFEYVKIDLGGFTLTGDIKAAKLTATCKTMLRFTGAGIVKGKIDDISEIRINTGNNTCIKEIYDEDNPEKVVAYRVGNHLVQTSFDWKDNGYNEETGAHQGFAVTRTTGCSNGCAEAAKNIPVVLDVKTTPAECEKDGKITYTAEYNGYKETRDVALTKTGHNYNAVFTPNVTATGITATVTFSCSNAECNIKDIKQDATVEIINDSNKPSCSDPGSVSFKVKASDPNGKEHSQVYNMPVGVTTDHVVRPVIYSNGTKNFEYRWENLKAKDAKSKGSIKCDIVITHCASNSLHELTDEVVYYTFTVDAKTKKGPVHKKGEDLKGSVETYDVTTIPYKVMYQDLADKEYKEYAENDAKIPAAYASVEFNDKEEHTIDRTISENYSYEAPTCVKDGKVTGTCSKCGEVVVNYELPKENVAHTPNPNESLTHKATCDNAGYTYTHCMVEGCTAEVKLTDIPKLGHKYFASGATKDAFNNKSATATTTVTVKCENEVLTKGNITVNPKQLTRIEASSCKEFVKYVIPANLNTVTHTDIELVSTDEFGAHSYKANWKWNDASYEKPYASLILTCTEKECDKVGKTYTADPSEIKYSDINEVKGNCEVKSYKEVTATATIAGKTYSDSTKLVSTDKTTGEGHTYTKGSKVTGDFENKKLNVECDVCHEPTTIDAVISEEIKADGQKVETLKGSIKTINYEAKREQTKIGTPKLVWEENAGFEDETTPLFVYGKDATKVAVVLNDKKLVKDTDYTVEIDSKNVGTRIVTIKGIGNYYGTVEKVVKVNPKAVTITLPKASNTVNELPSDYKPVVEGVVAGDDLNVKAVLDGDVIKATYDANANYDVKVVNGEFTLEEPEPVEPETTELNLYAPIWADANRVDGIVTYFTYGADPTDAVLYTNVNGKKVKLVKDVDYEISIDSKNAGTREVTVKGIGKYTGSEVYPVVIEKKAVTITLPNVQNTTNALPSAYKATVAGVVAGDNLNVKPVLAGSVIKATYDANANYDVKVVEGKLTVVKPAPKAQSISVKATGKLFKVAQVKKAAKTFSIGATCTSKKAVTAKKVSGSKKITVSKAGTVKIAKGTKKGTYTAKVKLYAPATSSYTSKTIYKTVTVKVK